MREYQDIGSAASSADSEVACVLPVPQCQWTVFPARERPAIAAVALVILGLLSAAVGVNAQSFVAAALAFAALFLSLNRFFFPSSFALDEQGITARFPFAKRQLFWSRIRRFVHDEKGGILFCSARPSFWDRWTGLPLMFPQDDPTPVERIRSLLQREKSCAG